MSKSKKIDNRNERVIISRDQARAEGKMFYYDGKLCKHGHDCARYVTNQNCVECRHIHNTSEEAKEYARQWQKDNPEYQS